MFGFKFPWTKRRELREQQEALERFNRRRAFFQAQRRQDQPIEYVRPQMDDGSHFPLPIVHYPVPDADRSVAWSDSSADASPSCDSSFTSDSGSSSCDSGSSGGGSE